MQIVTIGRAALAALVWAGLVLQFVLMVGGGEAGDRSWLTVKFFSYFTILTNLLVAMTLTVPLVAPASRLARLLDGARWRSAVAVYIFIVGVVYGLFLADVWKPEGWQLVADIVLHRVVPLLAALDWIFLVPKSGLKWSDAARWLAFPLVYSGWTFVHGAATGFYPYWFLDAAELGYAKAGVNAVLLAGLFLAVGLVAVGAARVRR